MSVCLYQLVNWVWITYGLRLFSVTSKKKVKYGKYLVNTTTVGKIDFWIYLLDLLAPKQDGWMDGFEAKKAIMS